MDRMLKSAATLAGRGEAGYAELGGILFVRVRIGGQVTTNAHADKMAEVRSEFEGKCFDTHTTELIGYTEAAANSLPVWLHDSDNASRYPKVVDELLSHEREQVLEPVRAGGSAAFSGRLTNCAQLPPRIDVEHALGRPRDPAT